MPRAVPWQDRFWPKVNRTATCWLWTGAQNSWGYGQFFKRHHDPSFAHRVAWELTHGEIPPLLYVLHRCDVKLCVNPEHLFLGTKRDNSRDRDAKGRTAKGSRIGTSKLTEDDARTIRSRFSPKKYGEYSCRSLCREFGISESTFYALVNGQTWKEVG